MSGSQFEWHMCSSYHPDLGPEDRLTAYWYYVLDAVPGVGQAFVDHVSSRSGLAPSKFLGSVDHPTGDRVNRPDFLIRCQDYDVLFEHKLDSPLGHGQLERYLALCQTRGQKLALIAASALRLEASVSDSPWFVRPREAGAPAHFLWQDVHHIVQRFPDRIACDFAEFLEALGLAHFNWAGLGDPFTSDEAARELRSLYDALAPMFHAPGVSCLKTANSLIYQIRRPFQLVRLINVGPLVSVAEWDRRVWGRVMALWVWARRPGGGHQRVLPQAHGCIHGSSPPIFVNDRVSTAPVPYDREVFQERQYYVPLSEVLVQSKELSQDRLVSFVRTAVEHLQGRRAHVQQDRSDASPAAALGDYRRE
jgi:hypothetical protein